MSVALEPFTKVPIITQKIAGPDPLAVEIWIVIERLRIFYHKAENEKAATQSCEAPEKPLGRITVMSVFKKFRRVPFSLD